jgi:hypothetical protein
LRRSLRRIIESSPVQRKREEVNISSRTSRNENR